jgi:hypothetical protein
VQIAIPLDPCCVLPRKSFSGQLISIGEFLERMLVPCSVEILMEKVQYKFKKLFRVLLLVDDPISSEVTAYSLHLVSNVYLDCYEQLTLKVVGRRAPMSPLYKLESSVA